MTSFTCIHKYLDKTFKVTIADIMVNGEVYLYVVSRGEVGGRSWLMVLMVPLVLMAVLVLMATLHYAEVEKRG